MKEDKEMVVIEAPTEWLDFCSYELMAAKLKVVKKIGKKFGNQVPIKMFLHVDLCNALHSIFVDSPNCEEALRFINAALQEVKEGFEIGDTNG